MERNACFGCGGSKQFIISSGRVIDVQANSATCLDSDHFANFLVKTRAKLLNAFCTESWNLN
ncbi:hypothetical protein C5167_026024 [Papaver somniferum]|nr:hypothetical protein C5167_026024 [Papaver somniferum]